MKFIIINRRKLGVTAIILGLMVVLFGFGKNFDAKLKEASLIYNNINSLVKYEGLNNTFSYKLPKEWTATEEKLGDEIIYHNRFTSQDKVIHGFMQVWKYEGDLLKFLELSKETNLKTQPSKYKEYDISSINLNNNKVYLLKYSVDTGNNNYYKAYEYFIGCTGKFFRFSFFIKEKDFKETMPNIFETIVKTLEHTH
jgi:hypothetical protein